jgi:hypothetical protein
VGEATYFHGRAGRQRRAKIFHAHIDVLKECIDVGGEGLGADEVGEACARRGQRGLEILADLADLLAHVALAHDLARAVARQET